MNCLEFHRLKLADPRRLSAEAQTHLEGCPDCFAFAQDVDRSERKLEQALITPVPDGLADRMLLGRRGSSRRVWRVWALAASVVLATALTVVYLGSAPPDQYARLAIEHLVNEPEALTTLRDADAEAFRTIVQNFGGTVKALPGRVRYIRLCPLEDGTTGWHIVFETPEGLATLLLVPGKQPDATQVASAEGWSALARPTPRGYYAVVTASSAATARIDRMVQERIDWKA